MVVETMVAPTHPSIGPRLVDIPFLQNIRARIIGLDRPAHDPGPDLASVRVRAADRLLVTGGTREVEVPRANHAPLGPRPRHTRPSRPRTGGGCTLCMAASRAPVCVA